LTEKAWQQAVGDRDTADKLRIEAEKREPLVRRHLYSTSVAPAQLAWGNGNLRQLQDLLSACRPSPGQVDLRGFEWHYLWRLAQQALAGSGLPVVRRRQAIDSYSAPIASTEPATERSLQALDKPGTAHGADGPAVSARKGEPVPRPVNGYALFSTGTVFGCSASGIARHAKA
jgi:hypothetical protein